MTGWTWEYIDDSMDLPRLADLNRHWAGSPPIHIQLAGFLGYEKPKKSPSKTQDEEIAELLGILAHAR